MNTPSPKPEPMTYLGVWAFARHRREEAMENAVQSAWAAAEAALVGLPNHEHMRKVPGLIGEVDAWQRIMDECTLRKEARGEKQ